MARRHSVAALSGSPRPCLLPDPSLGRSDVAPHQSGGPELWQRDGSVCTYQLCEAQVIPSCAYWVYTGALLGIVLPPSQKRLVRAGKVEKGALESEGWGEEDKSRTHRYKVQQASFFVPFVSHNIHF